jgi:5-methylcytosine-specific restriction endonuclease McrA
MPAFRLKNPTRTCTKIYKRHSSYKGYLIVDFSNRCGYCDGSDVWYGGYKSFHIDHFAPEKKFPTLKSVYSNLIYACPPCNGAKSDKWPSDDPAINIVGDEGFLNPVSDDLNNHFTRDDFGNISGVSLIAKDMVINLNLHLERHSVLWMLSKLDNVINEFAFAKESNSISIALRAKLEEAHYRLLEVFKNYLDKLKVLNT